jgi:hypothetical protein
MISRRKHQEALYELEARMQRLLDQRSNSHRSEVLGLEEALAAWGIARLQSRPSFATSDITIPVPEISAAERNLARAKFPMTPRHPDTIDAIKAAVENVDASSGEAWADLTLAQGIHLEAARRAQPDDGQANFDSHKWVPLREGLIPVEATEDCRLCGILNLPHARLYRCGQGPG